MSTYTCLPADPHLHPAQIARIIADGFEGGENAPEIQEQYIQTSHYDWDCTRLVFDGQRLVTHWGVFGYAMRVDGVALRTAGVGAVVTREDYRRQGLMELAARASFVAMHSHDYDLSVLHGRYYRKFGYRRAWNDATYRLKPGEIAPAAAAPAYRPLTLDHIPVIDELYNAAHRDFSGVAVRPTYRKKEAADLARYFGWFDARGQLAGYVRAVFQPNDKAGATLECQEAAGDPERCLAVLADLVQCEQHSGLKLSSLPHAHPMLQRIRRGTCTLEEDYALPGGWQVRLVNLATTLEKLRPRLERRLQASHLAGWRGDLLLDGGEQQAVLRLDAGGVQLASSDPGGVQLAPPAASDHARGCDHAVCAGPALARFLIGSDDPGEIISQEDVACTGMAAELVQVLFPNLHPMLSEWDGI